MRKVGKIVIYLSFVIYVLILLYIVFLSRIGVSSYMPDMSILEYAKINANLVPLKSILRYISAIITGSMNLSIPLSNLLGNLLMFFPMGIYIPFIFMKMRNIKRISVVTIILLLLLEILQFVTKFGEFDIDDIILNFVGAIFGYGVWKFKIVQKLQKLLDF